MRGRFVRRKRRLDDVDVFFLVCNLILLRKCQSAGERVCGHQILRALKGPLALTNRAVCPYLNHVRIPPLLLLGTAEAQANALNNAEHT